MKVEFVNMNYNLKEIRFLKINIWVEAQIAYFQHCSSHGLCDGDSGDSVGPTHTQWCQKGVGVIRSVSKPRCGAVWGAKPGCDGPAHTPNFLQDNLIFYVSGEFFLSRKIFGGR